ncbi:hypothetical protein [Dactylosporangium sp. NPDC051541]|uniref:hypothetical protein n=1 Tax=Dactylosporangium sp. NPDC051541 TaxID=3363977 RepID=UPI0037ADB9B8
MRPTVVRKHESPPTMETAHMGSNLLRKSLITLASAGLGYLLTSLARQPLIWALTMAVFIGGISLVVQFLIEFDGRVSQIDRRFYMINEATELFGRIESGGLRTETAIDLVKSATQVAELGSPILTRFVDDLLLHQSDVLRQLAHQRVADHPGDEVDWMLLLTLQAQTSIKATTMVGKLSVDHKFWCSQLAETYLQLQRAAIQRRQVKVQRLFIVGADWRNDDQIRAIVRRNIAALIEVRILDALPSSGLLEFIVFDDQVCAEFPQQQTVSGDATLSPTPQLRLRPEAVQRRLDNFESWWLSAHEVDQQWLSQP